MNTRNLLLICLGIFLTIAACSVFAWEAKAAQDIVAPFSMEKELLANAEADNPPITGWINVIGEKYLVIDDSQFAITKDTVFLVDKGALVSGVFVSLRTDAERNLLEVDIVEPTEEDLKRKPDEISELVNISNSENTSPKPDREDDLRFQDGKWVN